MLSRFAPVVPIQIAKQLQGNSVAEDVFGDYHLVLAHDILDKPGEYREVYSKVRERWRDSFIILDNSIVELGTAMDMGALIAAAAIVKPDCIVIPDVMGKGQETRDLAESFSTEYSKFMSSHKALTPYKLMGVLQGNDVEDCLRTYRDFWGLDHLGHIGVPRVITQQQGSRMPVLAELTQRSTFSRVHLLGFSDDLLDDVSCARMPIVTGIDSAVPIRAGINGQQLTLDFNDDYGKRGDYWNHIIESEDQQNYVWGNIGLINDWIKLKQVGE